MPNVHIQDSTLSKETFAVAKWKIEHQHKLEVRFVKPKIAYRETIRKMADASYKHKKQVCRPIPGHAHLWLLH